MSVTLISVLCDDCSMCTSLVDHGNYAKYLEYFINSFEKSSIIEIKGKKLGEPIDYSSFKFSSKYEKGKIAPARKGIILNGIKYKVKKNLFERIGTMTGKWAPMFIICLENELISNILGILSTNSMLRDYTEVLIGTKRETNNKVYIDLNQNLSLKFNDWVDSVSNKFSRYINPRENPTPVPIQRRDDIIPNNQEEHPTIQESSDLRIIIVPRREIY